MQLIGAKRVTGNFFVPCFYLWVVAVAWQQGDSGAWIVIIHVLVPFLFFLLWLVIIFITCFHPGLKPNAYIWVCPQSMFLYKEMRLIQPQISI